jgi:protein SCO1/2
MKIVFGAPTVPDSERCAIPSAPSWLQNLSWQKVLSRLLITIIVLLVAAFLWFVIARPVQVMPRQFSAPPFTLVDQNGQPLTNNHLWGTPYLVNFLYTGDEEAAPIMMDRMRHLQDRLRQAGLDRGVRLLTISFDSRHDTPSVLHAYGQRFGADEEIWSFATGDAAQLRQVVGKGFRVYYRSEGTDANGQFRYDRRLILVDEQGIVRAQYEEALTDDARIWRDLGLVIREAGTRGAARVLNEAAHLFLCYPR